MSKRYKAKRRFRYFVQRSVCQICGHSPAVCCFLPDPPRLLTAEREREREREPDQVLCSEHAEQYGYCRSCGDFWGGIESFDFTHPGLCDHCHDQIADDFSDGEDCEPDWDDWDNCDFNGEPL